MGEGPSAPHKRLLGQRSHRYTKPVLKGNQLRVRTNAQARTPQNIRTCMVIQHTISVVRQEDAKTRVATSFIGLWRCSRRRTDPFAGAPPLRHTQACVTASARPGLPRSPGRRIAHSNLQGDVGIQVRLLTSVLDRRPNRRWLGHATSARRSRERRCRHGPL